MKEENFSLDSKKHENIHVHVFSPYRVKRLMVIFLLGVVIFISILYVVDKWRVDKVLISTEDIKKNTNNIFGILQILARNDSVLYRNDSIQSTQLRHFPSSPPLEINSMSRVSSIYQNRVNPITNEKEFHAGIDYAAKKGTRVYASAEGVVIEAGKDDGYGNLVKINHQNGYETSYAHLDSIKVVVGEIVDKGTEIGTVGNTGSTTGAHLHYEISYLRRKINPGVFTSVF
jgi:murein DD-endopeptidase MepM/ murein hydrolase activator NlpD